MFIRKNSGDLVTDKIRVRNGTEDKFQNIYDRLMSFIETVFHAIVFEVSETHSRRYYAQ